jgi:hypothetical protein
MTSIGDDQSSGRERDRDEQGRPRSGRPRDGLGRPLPYGAAGVERQPEGVSRTVDETLAEAQRLLDAGRPFHAHEVFEDAWKAGDGTPTGREPLWQGLAQLAVGLTHAGRGNASGGATLLRRGAATIGRYRGSQPYGVNVDGLLRWAGELAHDLDAGVLPTSPQARAPRVRVG